MNKVDMLDLLCFNGEKEWMCHLRPTHPYWEDTEDIPFTNTVRNKLVRGVLATLRSSVIGLLCRPDLTVGTAVTEMGNLYAMVLNGFQGGSEQVAALNC